MYGVVLLMAVTAGGESADFGRHKGCGGCGGYVASCYGGCGGYAYGGCGGYAVSNYGGYGCGGYVASCYGGYGCGHVYHGCGHVYHGCGHVYHGCCGGHIHHGCCGGHIHHGCCGGHIHHGCCGGHIHHGHVIHSGHHGLVAAPAPNAATVVVTLPADATLTVDGAATTSTSSVRTFETPELTAGKTYAYTLEATFQQDGKPVVVSKKVTIEAGKTATVDLNSAPATATGVARN